MIRKLISTFLMFTMINLSFASTAWAVEDDTGPTLEETQGEEVRIHKGSQDDMLNNAGTLKVGDTAAGFSVLTTIAVFATLISCAGMLIKCAKQPSAIVGALASLAALGSLVSTWTSYIKESGKNGEMIKREATLYSDVDDDIQKLGLEIAQQQAEGMASTQNTAAILMTIAGSLYLVAAVLSILEQTLEIISYGTKSARCTTFNSNKYQDLSPMEEFELELESYAKQDQISSKLNQYFDRHDQKLSSLVQILSFDEKENKSNLSDAKYYDEVNTSIIDKAIGMQEKNLLLSIASKIFGVSDAKANQNGSRWAVLVGSMVGALGASVGTTMALSSAISETGVGRAVMFGVSAVFTGIEAGVRYHASDVYKKRAGIYSSLIAILDDKGVDIVNGGELDLEQGQVEYFSRSSEEDIDEGAPCSSGSTVGSLKPDLDCSCKKNNSCTKVNYKTSGFKDFNLGQTANKALALGKESLNDANRGKPSTAINNADFFKGAVGKLKKVGKKAEDQLNAKLKESGNKQIDFDKQRSLYTAKLKKAAEKAYNSLSQSDKDLFGSLTNAAVPEKYKSKEKPTVKRAPITSVSPKKKKGFNFSMDIGEDGDNQVDVDFSGEDKYKDTNVYSGKENDISGNKENIFDIITKTYIGHGYDRLFEKKKALPSE